MLKYPRQFQFLLVCVLLAAVLQGCTLPQEIYVFNNTSQPIDLTVLLGEQEQDFVILANQSVTIEIGALINEFTKIQIASTDLCYDLKLPGKGYWSHKGFGPISVIVFKFQIEEDGKVYILPAEKDFPFEDLSLQPDGYPLSPGCG